MTAIVVRGDARRLPLPDASVDLIVTSPPFWQLRSYTDGGVHYDGQIGSEPTWQEYIANLLDCTREWVRVLKPTGNLFVELGDKYSSGAGPQTGVKSEGLSSTRNGHAGGPKWAAAPRGRAAQGLPPKCLMDLPHRYVIRCVDDLGLIKRAEIPWHHVNGLPESVTDRVRRAHSMLFHLVKQPRYYAAVDEIREPHSIDAAGRRTKYLGNDRGTVTSVQAIRQDGSPNGVMGFAVNPLGKLPGSVWSIPSQPLQVPAHLGVDHFAAFPMELPRRCILGWSPPGVCTGCGEGRRPVSVADGVSYYAAMGKTGRDLVPADQKAPGAGGQTRLANGTVPSYPVRQRTITGYACGCTPYTDHPGTGESSNRRAYDATQNGSNPQGVYSNKAGEYERVGPWREYHIENWQPPPTRPAVVLDPFGGTGTTALVASVLGRHGITADLSADYCRLAAWRTTDRGEIARAMQVPKPPVIPDGQEALFT